MTEMHNVEPQGSAEEKSDMPLHQMIALGLSGTGFALSLLLEQLHVKTHTAPSAEHFCTLGSNFDCAAVAASPYALFLGLPWAIWGAIGYIALGLAAYKRSGWLVPLSAVAALTSVTLFLLSITVIGSVCLLCEAVHAVSIALFVVAYKDRDLWTGKLGDWPSATLVIGLPAGLALGAILFVPAYWSSFSWKADPPFSTGQTEEGHHWIGSDDPDVTIHEWVNYRCPFCKVGSDRTLRMIGAQSDWRIIRRAQPLMSCVPGREGACQPSRMAYCAGKQGKFWRADRWLFGHAKQKQRFDRSALIHDLKLDASAFEDCYKSDEAFNYNNASFQDAKEQGISAVPGYRVETKGELPPSLESMTRLGEKKPEKK